MQNNEIGKSENVRNARTFFSREQANSAYHVLRQFAEFLRFEVTIMCNVCNPNDCGRGGRNGNCGYPLLNELARAIDNLFACGRNGRGNDCGCNGRRSGEKNGSGRNDDCGCNRLRETYCFIGCGDLYYARQYGLFNVDCGCNR